MVALKNVCFLSKCIYFFSFVYLFQILKKCSGRKQVFDNYWMEDSKPK